MPLGGDNGGGASRQSVTNGDHGIIYCLWGDKGERGVKSWDFYGDIDFEWPLRYPKIRIMPIRVGVK